MRTAISTSLTEQRTCTYQGRENVYPAEIERVLREHPDIADAAVIGMLDDTYGEAGHAFIITESKAMLSEEDVTFVFAGKGWPVTRFLER